MASLGICHSGIGDCVIRKQPVATGSLPIPYSAVKLPNRRPSTAVNAAVAYDSGLSLFNSALDLQTTKISESEYNDHTSIESPRVSNNLDEWIQNSVTEIVRNIKQAPLLVQIYADGEVKTKRALPEKDWKNVVKQRSAALEGVILVEELNPAEEDDEGDRAFGVLIQGRSKGRGECKSSCYLLKTSRGDGGGLGHVCTHFCLMKVKSFHQDAFSQFRDCWLVQ